VHYLFQVHLMIEPHSCGTESNSDNEFSEPDTLMPEVAERGLRLDRFLAGRYPALSRSYLQRVLAGEGVTVDGVVRQQTFKVTPGQVVAITFPESEETELVPEPLDLDIVFENEHVLVLEKPAGMVVHPAPGHFTGTLVNGLVHYLPDLQIAGSNRPGIVHRLDKDTSGLMVVAKTDEGQTSLAKQWAYRSVDKRYLALVRGVIEENEGTIDAPIGRSAHDRLRMAVLASGRPALSHFTVLQRLRGATFVEIHLITGRTHQIRVHMSFIGHPVVGDAIYNRTSGRFGGAASISPRQFLHASLLSFRLPVSEEQVTFESTLPDALAEPLRVLEHELTALGPS
jgi:23S rRNA pseudouridine1911/1915/1917 synthase